MKKIENRLKVFWKYAWKERQIKYQAFLHQGQLRADISLAWKLNSW